jgi:SAM-dependent methyltransferase
VGVGTGTGPGVITPDGCAVDLYAPLPPMGEPGVVHAAIPVGASILELGAGAGRVTHPLVALGHPVVAVDESPEMLARIRGAETVRARVQDLELGRRFDAVLLASTLVNVPDPGLRGRFLEACRNRVRDGGCVLVRRHPPSWFDEEAPGERSAGGGITFRRATSAGPVPACSPPPSSTRWASASGPSRSPPNASTTGPWRPPWPRPGWPSTPT